VTRQSIADKLIALKNRFNERGMTRQLFEIRIYVKQSRKGYLTCRICKKPLRLGIYTTTDENGKAVHEKCQVKTIIGTQRYEELTRGRVIR
jgi:hypothetical protein